MTKSQKWLTALSALALGIFCVVTLTGAGGADEKNDADEQEQTVTVDQLPDAVKAAVMKAAHGAKIREVERETENGKVTYEVELVIETELEIELTEDGQILGIEIEHGHEHEEEDDK